MQQASTRSSKISLISVPGKRAVQEALDSGLPAKELAISDGVRDARLLKSIIDSAQTRGIRVVRLNQTEFKKRFAGIERADQGIVLVGREFAYASLNDIVKKAQADYERDAFALVVVCDHITDAGNLGAIIRSADSVGASGAVIPNRRSAQVNSSTYKTSAGAVAHLPVAKVPNIRQALSDLKEAGFWVIACTEHADEAAWDVDMRGRTALVLGNEQKGISDLVLENCDDACMLPQRGAVSSLNVAQAATAMMYEWLRQNELSECRHTQENAS